MAHLTLVLDNREVRKFVLNRGVTTIGRAQENDIVINNLALSRRHAQVEFKAGRFEIVDLQSQNGVFVNQEKLRGPRVLEDKDSVTLGTYQFVFTGSEDSEPEVRARPGRAPGGPKPVVRPPTEPEIEEESEPENEVPLLVLKYNDVELQRFALQNAVCLIGRAKECDLQVAERRLSRKHCEIHSGNGRYVLKDLGSQNGTYVNRRRIRGTHELRHGDVLNFAEYSVLFLADLSAYAGPDADARPAGRPSAEPGVEKLETMMPPAYRDDSAPRPEDPIRPSDLEEDPDDPPAPVSPRPRPARDEPLHDPLIKSPAEARAQRKGQVRAIREGRRDVPSPREEEDDSHSRAETPIPRKTQPPPGRERISAPPPEKPERKSEPAPKKRENRWGDARRVDEERRPERPSERPERPSERPEERRAARPSEPLRREEKRPSEPARRADERRSRAPEDNAMLRAGGIRVEPAAKRRAEERPRDEIVDVPDDESPERDDALNDWYQARGERSEMFEAPDEPVEPQDLDDADDLAGDGEEPSELIPRGRSSVSRVLSTMMVDKRELDTNLRGPKTKQRKFYVDVRHGDKVIYSGPLTQSVTILGTDREADIQLKGRYVAGRHSLFVRVRDSLLLVRLGSSSAARVNGLPKLQAFLKSGDTIQIDETTIKLSED